MSEDRSAQYFQSVKEVTEPLVRYEIVELLILLIESYPFCNTASTSLIPDLTGSVSISFIVTVFGGKIRFATIYRTMEDAPKIRSVGNL